jgi:hypothetical protein
METKVNKKKIGELLELLEMPEISQIIFAKLEQAKLIFAREIHKYKKNKYPNLLEFPAAKQNRVAEQDTDPPEEINHQNILNRIEWTYKRGFFDTTHYMKLGEDEQIAVFQEYFKNNKEFRKEILHEFFLKKMPYSDIYQDTG